MVKHHTPSDEGRPKRGVEEEQLQFEIYSDKMTTNFHENEPLFVIAIGGSDGSLEPLQILFSKIRSHASAAFVIIQHRSPDFKSLMNECLVHHTDMEIAYASAGMKLRPNTIHLIPPHKSLILDGDRFVLLDHDTRNHRQHSIDIFMEALARAWKERAIAIILSGSGSDGGRGIQAIAQEGGLVVVQTPETAKCDSMPRACLASKAGKLTLNPADMPEMLCRHMNSEVIKAEGCETSIEILDPTRQILDLLRGRFGSDFGYYKQSTVNRRIRRRVDFARLAALEDYVDFLKSSPSELEALYHDILIGVTAFMRDRESFDVLARKVIPKIGPQMANASGIRIWIPGCATGEEVYSIAILLADFAEREQLDTSNYRL